MGPGELPWRLEGNQNPEPVRLGVSDMKVRMMVMGVTFDDTTCALCPNGK